jgi:hypothetical protein
MWFWIDTAVDFVALYPHAALGVVFLAAIIEAVAVLGILIPGTPILMAAAGAAAMAGQAMLPFLAVSIIGAVIGDFLSFWVGGRFSHRLRRVWPLRHLQRRTLPVPAGVSVNRASGRRDGGHAPAPLRPGQCRFGLRLGSRSHLPGSSRRPLARAA